MLSVANVAIVFCRVSTKKNNLLRISIKICSHLARIRPPSLGFCQALLHLILLLLILPLILMFFFFFISCRLSIRGAKQMPASTGARQRTSWAWQGAAMRRCKWRVSCWKRTSFPLPLPLSVMPLHATCPKHAATSLSGNAGYARVCVFNILNWCWFLPQFSCCCCRCCCWVSICLWGSSALLFFVPGRPNYQRGCGTAHLTN